MITREDMDAWREHPVTEAVVKALGDIADQCETRFKTEAWAGVDVSALTQPREQARAYRDLIFLINSPDAHEKLADRA